MKCYSWLYFVSNALTLDDEIRTQNGCGADAHASFSGSIGGTETGEDDRGRAAHGAKEGLYRQRTCQHSNKRFHLMRVRRGTGAGCLFEG